jgi:ABC-type phosphate transport system substrate-binding protein
MRKRKIERMALTTFALAACVALFGALAAGQADARGAGSHGQGAIRSLSGPPLLDGASSMQPHFNPSVPYTVPQSPETPVSPGSPGSVFGPR